MPVRRFIDILNWGALVAPGVMLCKDRSLLAGWQVSGIDTESMEPEAVAGRLRHLGFALSGMTDGEALWVVYNRRPWRPDPDDIPRETGQTALDVLALEAHFLLADGGDTWEDRLFVFLSLQPSDDGDLSKDLTRLDQECARLESRFKSALVFDQLRPADVGAPCPFCEALSGLLAPGSPAPRFGPDDLPVGLDRLLGADVRQPSRAGGLQIDGRSVAILSLEGLPNRYDLLPMERFQSLPLPFTWVTRYQALSNRSARAEVRRQQRFWTQAAADFMANIGGQSQGRRDRYGDEMAGSLEGVLARLSRGEEGHGWYSSQFIVHATRAEGDEGLNDAIAMLEAAADDAAYRLRYETGNALPALLSALPGHIDINERRVLMRAQAMADLMPVRSIWQGSPVCPSPRLPADTKALLSARARTGERFHLNLHHGDVGHTLIFGPTGAGKSVLLGQIVSGWLRYPDAQVIYFDRQRSIAHACKAMGGSFLEPGISGRTGIAPLAHLPRLGAQWGLDWLTALVEMGLDGKPSPEQAAELRAALSNLTRVASDAGAPAASLQRIWEFVQDKTLRQVLMTWIEGPLAGLFDEDGANIAATLGQSRFTVFETPKMLEASAAVRILSLDYVFAETEARFDGRPTLVVLDEAWSFFGHELFVRRLRSWLKEGRKNNIAVVMATQSVADAARAEITADLLESCPTRIFLPNPEAETRVTRTQYSDLGLEPAQIDIVARIQPKRDLYLMQPHGRRIISLPVGPAALSILGRTGSEHSASALSRAATDPEFWTEDLYHDTDGNIDLRRAEAAE